MAQVFDLADPKHALFPVEHHPMLLQAGQDSLQVSHLLSVVGAGDQTIVHIDKHVRHILQDLIHQLLKGLARVAQPEGHAQVLEEPGGSTVEAYDFFTIYQSHLAV